MKMQPQELENIPASTLQGLSESEVAARRAQGLGNTMPVKTSRSYVQIVRENIFNPINNVLYSLGITLALLGKISDAFISVCVVSMNVTVSVIQEVRAKRTLDRIAVLTRPKATVMRSGKEQSVDPGDVVVGDILLVRPGDQIVVDGPVLSTNRLDVDEPLPIGLSCSAPMTGCACPIGCSTLKNWPKSCSGPSGVTPSSGRSSPKACSP